MKIHTLACGLLVVTCFFWSSFGNAAILKFDIVGRVTNVGSTIGIPPIDEGNIGQPGDTVIVTLTLDTQALGVDFQNSSLAQYSKTSIGSSAVIAASFTINGDTYSVSDLGDFAQNQNTAVVQVNDNTDSYQLGFISLGAPAGVSLNYLQIAIGPLTSINGNLNFVNGTNIAQQFNGDFSGSGLIEYTLQESGQSPTVLLPLLRFVIDSISITDITTLPPLRNSMAWLVWHLSRGATITSLTSEEIE